MNISNIKKHPSILYTKELNEICLPLLKLHDINYFSHSMVDNEKRFAGLATNPNFVEHYVRSKYYNCDMHLIQSDIQIEYIVQDKMSHKGLTASLAHDSQEFGIYHTFTIIQRNHAAIHVYHFATGVKNSSINDSYLRILPALQTFIIYFSDMVRNNKKISSCYDLHYSLEKSHEVAIEQLQYQRDIKEFLSSVQSARKKYPYTLSIRQTECLLLLLKGMSMKQIGNTLNLSARTIEHYIETIKEKFNCHTRYDLVIKAYQLGFQDLLFQRFD